jgi:hypothetical protein
MVNKNAALGKMINLESARQARKFLALFGSSIFSPLR